MCLDRHLNYLFKGVVGAPLNRFKPSSKIFLTDRSKAVLLLWTIYVISVLFCYVFMHVCMSMPCGHLLGKLSFVMSNCDVVTFPLVFWVRVVLHCIDS